MCLWRGVGPKAYMFVSGGRVRGLWSVLRYWVDCVVGGSVLWCGEGRWWGRGGVAALSAAVAWRG